MLEINQDNAASFLRRFYSFYDSVIRRFEVTFRFHGRVSTASVVIAARDEEGNANQGWVFVRFEIEDVTELRCSEEYNTTYTVLSEALHIGFFDDSIYIDFGALPDLAGSDDKHRSLDNFRCSAFYIAGRKITWHIEPYQE